MKLALTPGEPAGIGPDLAIQLAQEPLPVELVAFADPDLLEARAAQLGLPLRLIPHDHHRPPRLPNGGELSIASVPLRAPAEAGRLDPANAAYVLDTLRIATHACLSGDMAGLVTGPVHKGVINEAGVPFSGHTEFLAELSGGHPVMMLATGHLRVALATTHLPLRAVADAIDQPTLERVCRILDHDLRSRFGIARPRILVAGLNPHAGEGGHLGREEIEIIEPVLERLRAEGWTWSARCPPTPSSPATACRARTPCSPCTTTRACRCSSTRALARRSTSPSACRCCAPRSTTAPRWNWPAPAAPGSTACARRC